MQSNVYLRQTRLPNVAGRLDYISSPKRQKEHLIGYYDGATELLDGAYWQTVAQEAQTAFATYGQQQRVRKNKRTGEMVVQQCHAVEAREIVLALPVTVLQRMSPNEVCKTAEASFRDTYNRPCAVALHYKRKENNLHLHMIYSEREMLPEPIIKRATRALFLDAEGRRVYKKTEIMDSSGNLLPGCKIIPKGDVYKRNAFAAADPQFAKRAWLKNAKQQWAIPLLNGALRAQDHLIYKMYDPSTGELPQRHIGKKLRSALPEVADDWERYNSVVKQYNAMVQTGAIDRQTALQIQADINSLPLYKAEELEKVINMTKARWEDEIDREFAENARHQKMTEEVLIQLKKDWEQEMEESAERYLRAKEEEKRAAELQRKRDQIAREEEEKRKQLAHQQVNQALQKLKAIREEPVKMPRRFRVKSDFEREKLKARRCAEQHRREAVALENLRRKMLESGNTKDLDCVRAAVQLHTKAAGAWLRASNAKTWYEAAYAAHDAQAFEIRAHGEENHISMLPKKTRKTKEERKREILIRILLGTSSPYFGTVKAKQNTDGYYGKTDWNAQTLLDRGSLMGKYRAGSGVELEDEICREIQRAKRCGDKTAEQQARHDYGVAMRARRVEDRQAAKVQKQIEEDKRLLNETEEQTISRLEKAIESASGRKKASCDEHKKIPEQWEK